MGQDTIPFLFRGLPADNLQKQRLIDVLLNADIQVEYAVRMLSLRFNQRYHPSMDDRAVWELHSFKKRQMLQSTFARLIPIIPYLSDIGSDRDEVTVFLSQRLQNVDADPRTAKHFVFLQSSADAGGLLVRYPIGSRSNRYLRKANVGLLMGIPIFDEREARNVLGSIKEFVSCSNSELESRYTSLTGEASRDGNPPPSRR